MPIDENHGNARGRNFLFTINNPTEAELDNLRHLVDDGRANYVIFQLEQGEGTGTLHAQGYLELPEQLRYQRVRGILLDRAHVEARRGTQAQAIRYCSKAQTRVEGPYVYGTPKEQGKRTDLHVIVEELKAGKRLSELMTDYASTICKYPRGLSLVESHYRQSNANCFRQVAVLVFYGRTGTGKTRAALGDYSTPYFVLDSGNNLWWDGYCGQQRLVLDDFTGWIKFGTLLRILDGHPLRCEIKGGFTWAEYTEIIITSNLRWEQWYRSITDLQRDALGRRVTCTCIFDDTPILIE